MPKLVAYGMLSATSNALAGNLVKAQCYICGRKYGSVEEAKKCEVEHFNKSIINEIIRGSEEEWLNT